MTVYPLGSLGIADVVPKKSLNVKINIPWDSFSLIFAAEIANLSTGTIAVLHEAIISKKEVKIKKEDEELGKFFASVKSALEQNPSSVEDEAQQNAKKERQKAEEQARILRQKQFQARLKVEEEHLRVEAAERHKAEEELRRAEEERQRVEEERRRAEEERERIDRLKELVSVSLRLNRKDIAKYLRLTEDDLFRKLVIWAKQFGFKLDGEDVVFEGGQKDKFVEELESEFERWRQGDASGKKS